MAPPAALMPFMTMSPDEMRAFFAQGRREAIAADVQRLIASNARRKRGRWSVDTQVRYVCEVYRSGVTDEERTWIRAQFEAAQAHLAARDRAVEGTP